MTMHNAPSRKLNVVLWIALFCFLSFIYAFPPKIAYYPVPRDADEFMVEMIKVGMESRIISDAKGKILYASPTASEITEHSQDELKNSNISILIPERYMSGHNSKFDQSLQRHDGKVISTRCYLKTKSGTEIPVEIRTRVMSTSVGKVILATLTKLEELVEEKAKL